MTMLLRSLLIVACIQAVAGCESGQSKGQQSDQIRSVGSSDKAVAETTSTKAKQIELVLLDELDSFKKSSSFKTYGFAPGGPHHGWLTRVQQAKKIEGLDVKTKISLGELETLGREYLRTGGVETDSTRWFRRRVLDPFGDD